ncbi:MAG: cobalamin biosynthesis protein CbiX [Verrucomicrobia bacterium]|nr:cobalamin biosynthesis protein CbiX [Verrucomicrobiota bacterium]MDE3098275.1 cobalamin biosynthesis protein CbiX [Verrucomicrobiota bacterium]
MNGDDFSDAALVILGHGTTQNENSAAAALQHTSELRRRGIFRAVHEAFWKQEPHIHTVLAGIEAPRVFVAPLFISDGWFAGREIPRALGFSENHAPIRMGKATVFYCKSVGTHESMARVLLCRAENVVKEHPFPALPRKAETTLFIAGHGTEKSDSSRQPAERQVELIRSQGIYDTVHAIFLEERPRIAECYSLARTKNMVIVPFFISDGLHTQQDIPVLLGEARKIVGERLAKGMSGWRNPTERNERRIWYSPAAGSAPELTDVILERVQEAWQNGQSAFTQDGPP